MPRRWAKARRVNKFETMPVEILAVPRRRMGDAVRLAARHVGFAAHHHESREAAGGVSEHADAIAVEVPPLRPRRQHVIDDARDMSWPADQVEPPANVALIHVVVTGVIDGEEHDAGGSKGTRRFGLPGETAPGSVRNREGQDRRKPRDRLE